MKGSHRPVLLAGRHERNNADAVVEAASAASLLIESAPTLAETREWLDQHEPCAVALNVDGEDAESIAFALRSDPRNSLVPILGLAHEVTDLRFIHLYGLGGDDLVTSGSTQAIARRLRQLPSDLAHEVQPRQGLVLVADADDRRRLLTARVLRNAGFDVRFAVSMCELAETSQAAGIAMVCAQWDLAPENVLSAARKAREAGSPTPWVLSAPPQRYAEVLRAVGGIEGIAVSDSFAPLENMIFIANEVLRPSLAEKRASPRLLYGATIAFRAAGRDTDEFGYTYNLSGEGLYVRTLAPLAPGDEAWIELQPPRTDRRVRLEAKVVWQRLFGRSQMASVPPGFGLFITGGSSGDMKRYRQGYEIFGRELAAIRTSMSPAADK